MSNKLNIFRKLWGKNKSDNESFSKLQPKDKDFLHITFDNHENPEASFTLDLGDKHPVFYRLSDVKNTQDNEEKMDTNHEEEEMEVIMSPKQRRESNRSKEPGDVKIIYEPPQGSVVLSQPQVITWKNKDAYVYKVESEYYKDSERPDLEFVIYIPIDTAVKWLDNKDSNLNNDKKGGRVMKFSEKDLKHGEGEKELKYGLEGKDESNKAVVTWNNKKNNKYDSDADEGTGKTGMKSMGESLDADEDVDEDNMRRNTEKSKGNKGQEEDKDKMNRKPDKAKESKVKVPPMTKKKARTVTTIYEEDEDTISLGRLRPRLQDKKSVQIVETNKLTK